MSNWVSNNSPGTMKTVRRVSHSSNSGSKSLWLGGASVFSLVWLWHRLVGNLASWTSMITSSNYWSISRMTKSMGMCMEHSGVVGYSRGSGDQANKALTKHMKMYISLGVCIIIFFFVILFPLKLSKCSGVLPSCYLLRMWWSNDAVSCFCGCFIQEICEDQQLCSWGSTMYSVSPGRGFSKTCFNMNYVE